MTKYENLSTPLIEQQVLGLKSIFMKKYKSIVNAFGIIVPSIIPYTMRHREMSKIIFERVLMHVYKAREMGTFSFYKNTFAVYNFVLANCELKCQWEGDGAPQ